MAMTEKQKLKEALAFLRVCWENLEYQHEIKIDMSTDLPIFQKSLNAKGGYKWLW